MKRRPALIVALAVFVAAGVGAELTHGQASLPLPSRIAIRDALRDSRTATDLRNVRWTRVTTSPVDRQLERVSFYAGPRIVAEVAVRSDGTVAQAVDFKRLRVPYGDWLAYEPALLLALSVMFVLMAGVAPLRRLRNLDVAAVLSLLAPAVLLQNRYLDASVLSAVPGLCYLTARCAWRGLGSGHEPSAPSTPLFDRLTASWNARERVRILRIALAALVLVFVMVGISSPDAVDVIYAVMEGATRLIHGVLPYGHMPGDVIHGDTYPLLSYALYTPLAALSPVSSTWDSVDGALAVAVIAAAACAGGLYRATVGPRAPRRQRRPPHQEIAGLRAALTWLAFPPLLITVSSGTTDVVLAALLGFAVLLWRKPVVSSGLLALAGWFKLAPFVLIPIWLAPLRGRRLLSAVGAIAGVSAAMIGLLVALGGLHGPSAMIHAIAFQFSRGSPQSVWSVLGIESLQPIGEAAVLALVAGGAVRLMRDRDRADDRAGVVALAAAIMFGLQLSADYWSFLYLSWVVPLLVLSLLAEPARALERQPALAKSFIARWVPALGR
jgi:hypothetical protein